MNILAKVNLPSLCRERKGSLYLSFFFPGSTCMSPPAENLSSFRKGITRLGKPFSGLSGELREDSRQEGNKLPSVMCWTLLGPRLQDLEETTECRGVWHPAASQQLPTHPPK